MSVEELTKKKRIRAGHKASATRMMDSAEDLLKTSGSDTSRLTQLSWSLQEKLDVLTMLDSEIITLSMRDRSWMRSSKLTFSKRASTLQW